MKLIKPALLLTISTLTCSFTAQAASYYDYAKVTKVRPVYKYVKIKQPVEQCETVRRSSRRHDATPTIVGAIIGGAIGNAIGDSRASTVAGAVIGGSITHNSNRRYGRVVEHCQVSYQTTRKVRKLDGYKVKYRYKGETFKTFMNKHPGDKIKVRVKVSPAY